MLCAAALAHAVCRQCFLENWMVEDGLPVLVSWPLPELSPLDLLST